MFRGRNNVVAFLNFVANVFFYQKFNGGISGRIIISHIYFGELRIRVRQLRDVNNAIYQRCLVVAAREFVLSKLWVKR